MWIGIEVLFTPQPLSNKKRRDQTPVLISEATSVPFLVFTDTFGELAFQKLELPVIMTELISKNSRLFCQHCEEKVSKRTYYNHKRLYFDRKTRRWSKTRLFISDTNAEHTTHADNVTESTEVEPVLAHYPIGSEDELSEPGTLYWNFLNNS